MQFKNKNNHSGFTIVEIIVVMALVAILGSIAVSKFADFRQAANQAMVDSVVSSLRAAQLQYRAKWMINGSPSAGNTLRVDLDVDGISVRYRNGYVVNVNTLNHVPVGTPNRSAANTRIFFLFLREIPGEVIPASSSGTGWVMLGNGSCASVFRPRCWEYRVDGTRFARITYAPGVDGQIIVD